MNFSSCPLTLLILTPSGINGLRQKLSERNSGVLLRNFFSRIIYDHFISLRL